MRKGFLGQGEGVSEGMGRTGRERYKIKQIWYCTERKKLIELKV